MPESGVVAVPAHAAMNAQTTAKLLGQPARAVSDLVPLLEELAAAGILTIASCLELRRGRRADLGRSSATGEGEGSTRRAETVLDRRVVKSLPGRIAKRFAG